MKVEQQKKDKKSKQMQNREQKSREVQQYKSSTV